MLDDKTRMIISTLEDVIYSLDLIITRFKDIEVSDDFLKDDIGLEKLDSISMRLIAIGEGFKNIDKLSDKLLLSKYSNIPWKDVKGVRDILSHHYFDLDSEVIFKICQNDINDLLNVSKQIIKDLI